MRGGELRDEGWGLGDKRWEVWRQGVGIGR